jgi:hypothetical protein
MEIYRLSLTLKEHKQSRWCGLCCLIICPDIADLYAKVIHSNARRKENFLGRRDGAQHDFHGLSPPVGCPSVGCPHCGLSPLWAVPLWVIPPWAGPPVGKLR